MDPLAEKYPNISSYVYCADNPVKFVDPDGRRIFIAKGSGDFQQRAFMDMQKITSHNLYLLKSREVVDASKYRGNESNIVSRGVGFVSIVLPFKDRNGNVIDIKDGYKPAGTKIISDVLNTSQKFQIVEADPDKEKAVLKSENPELVPSAFDGVIQYNPNSTNSNEKMADGTWGKPAFLALAHEFVHTFKAMIGNLRNRRDRYASDPDTNSTSTISEEEYDTRIKTDPVHIENGKSPRATPSREGYAK